MRPDPRGDESLLARERAALRRLTTLPARRASRAEIFAAVAEELGRVLEVEGVRMVRYERGGEAPIAVVDAVWGEDPDGAEVGQRWPLADADPAAEVLRTGAATRTRSAAASPIVLDGEVWGAVVAATAGGSLPAGTERQLDEATELLGLAIAGAEARAQVERLAEEQAALRRVATLVAQGAAPSRLFEAVIYEARKLLGGGQSGLMRFEGGREAVILARESGSLTVTPPGTRLPLQGDSAIVRVFRTGRPARIDLTEEGRGPTAELVLRNRSAVSAGAPITVEGEIWGALVVSWETHQTAPAGAEDRLAEFAALLETAIANAEARSEVGRLVAEQAALRRVATLVAEGAAPSEVFEAAILEVRKLLGAAQVGLMRAEGPDEIVILAHSGQTAGGVRPGLRLPLAGDSVTARVLRTGHSAQVDAYAEDGGAIAAIARSNGVATTVGAPVMVEGAPWGVITVSWLADQRPPRDAEQRLVKFAQLLDTAIANADSRDQLMASRVRVLTAGDEARRRLVRDLHDGAQQRLVHTIVDLKLAQQALDDDPGRAAELLAEALDHAQRGNEELRELAHGIIPSVLTRGGLRAALDALVSRLDLAVDLDVTGERLAPAIEASAYFIAAEALTNVVKHARASRARVSAAVVDDTLRLQVTDDGIGGADPDGHGLVGLADRVDALRGSLRIDSPAGGGTVLEARLPIRPAAPVGEAAQRPSDSRR